MPRMWIPTLRFLTVAAAFGATLAALPAAPFAPKKIELEVNLPLARQLGAKVPLSLLESATRTIK